MDHALIIALVIGLVGIAYFIADNIAYGLTASHIPPTTPHYTTPRTREDFIHEAIDMLPFVPTDTLVVELLVRIADTNGVALDVADPRDIRQLLAALNTHTREGF